MTSGTYVGDARRAYFFHRDSQDDSTLYHEATHQLFSEGRAAAREPGRLANFWIVEGIACYFESLRRQGPYVTLGGGDTQRLADARHRLLVDQFYVPLEEFCGLGMEQLQADPQIARLYTQSAGLTHFLIHGQGGRYRDALVAYLEAVYLGRDEPATLAELAGKSFAELDREYRQFLEALPTGGASDAALGALGN